MENANQIQVPAALADRLSFQLYVASRAMVGAYRRKLLQFELTYPQYLTMHAVWEIDGRTVSELCAELDLDSGTVSPILARLESEGYIARERVGADGRQVRVFCTDRGQRLKEQVLLVPSDIATALEISDEEYDDLCRLLGTLRKAVRDV